MMSTPITELSLPADNKKAFLDAIKTYSFNDNWKKEKWPTFRNNRLLMLEAIKSNPKAITLASENLINDISFTEDALNYLPKLDELISYALELIPYAQIETNKRWWGLLYHAFTYKITLPIVELCSKNKSVALAATKNPGLNSSGRSHADDHILNYFADEFKEDLEILISLKDTNPAMALDYAGDTFLKDNGGFVDECLASDSEKKKLKQYNDEVDDEHPYHEKISLLPEHPETAALYLYPVELTYLQVKKALENTGNWGVLAATSR